jgi:hypothetical protein
MSLLNAIRKVAGCSTAIESYRKPSAALVQKPREVVVAAAVQQIVGSVAMAPASAPERAMVRQEIRGMARLEKDARQVVMEQELFLRAVWHWWEERGLGFDEAVTHARTEVWERCPTLQAGGHKGVDLLNVHNARRWMHKLGGKRGTPPRFDLAMSRLVDGYGNCGRKAEYDAEFMQTFSRLYLSPGMRTLAGCWRAARDQFRADGIGDRAASLEQCTHYARTRISERARLKARCGRDYKNLIKGFIRRNKNFGPNDVWFMDHRTVDFWVKWPHPENAEKWVILRPYVTAVMDGFTGRILAYVMYCDQYPNSAKIMEAFELALRTAGMRPPKVLYTDNGKDFLKQGFAVAVQLRTKKGELVHREGKVFEHSCLAELKVEHKLARGYNGREKPVERLFRDQAMEFDTMQPGYCGNSPATRPDYGETFQGDANKLPTLGQAAEELAAWVTRHNAEAMAADKPSPDEIWAAADWTLFRTISDVELFLAMLLPQPLAPEVGRSSYGLGAVMLDGVAYTHRALREFADGMLYGQPVMLKTYWGMPAFADAKGKRHPRAVFVCHPDGRMICLAEPEESAAMLARTPQEKEQLARLCHVVAAAAKLDNAELEEHTGSGRVRMTCPELDRAAIGQSAPVVAIGTPGLGTRRLPGGQDVQAAAAATAERESHAVRPVTRDDAELLESCLRGVKPAVTSATGDDDLSILGSMMQ